MAVPQVVLQLFFACRGVVGQRPGGEGPTPPVDLIVPCFNEPPFTLRACLQSLAAQDYRGSLTVWLVDDGSANRDAGAMIRTCGCASEPVDVLREGRTFPEDDLKIR